MEREEAYDGLYREIALYEQSVEGAFIKANKLDLLQKVSALTDAVAFEKLSISEARYLLREHIQVLRAALANDQPHVDNGHGEIKF